MKTPKTITMKKIIMPSNKIIRGTIGSLGWVTTGSCPSIGSTGCVMKRRKGITIKIIRKTIMPKKAKANCHFF